MPPGSVGSYTIIDQRMSANFNEEKLPHRWNFFVKSMKKNDNDENSRIDLNEPKIFAATTLTSEVLRNREIMSEKWRN